MVCNFIVRINLRHRQYSTWCKTPQNTNRATFFPLSSYGHWQWYPINHNDFSTKLYKFLFPNSIVLFPYTKSAGSEQARNIIILGMNTVHLKDYEEYLPIKKHNGNVADFFVAAVEISALDQSCF